MNMCLPPPLIIDLPAPLVPDIVEEVLTVAGYCWDKIKIY